MIDHCTVRRVTKKDVFDMAEIHARCFAEIAWTVDAFAEYFTMPMWSGVYGFCVAQLPDTPSDMCSDRCSGDYESLSANRVVGFILGRTTQSDNDILTFAVHPQFQNKGVGRHLLQTYVDALECSCLLEVAVANQAAVHLYQKFDFKIIHTRADYYEAIDPTMRDAYVMQKVI